MLYWPFRSPLSASKRWPGSTARSLRVTAASSRSSFMRAARSIPENCRTRLPAAKSRVCLFRKPAIMTEYSGFMRYVKRNAVEKSTTSTEARLRLSRSLQRLRIRQVPGRVPVQHSKQFLCRGRRADFAATNDVAGAYFPAVQLFVRAAVGTQSRSFQRHAGEQPARTGVGENLRPHGNIGGSSGVAALRSGGSGGIGTQLHLAAHKAFRAFRIHDQQHKVRRLAAELESDVAALQRVHGRRAPMAGEVLAGAAGHNAAAVAAPDPNRQFLD